jgi:hypothetical protein
MTRRKYRSRSRFEPSIPSGSVLTVPISSLHFPPNSICQSLTHPILFHAAAMVIALFAIYEQVNGYAKKFAGKVFGNEGEKDLGEKKLAGQA